MLLFSIMTLLDVRSSGTGSQYVSKFPAALGFAAAALAIIALILVEYTDSLFLAGKTY